MQLGIITRVTGAGLVAAGLLSVLLFPALALTLLAHDEPPTQTMDDHTHMPTEKEAME
jgi:hypothetical protein